MEPQAVQRNGHAPLVGWTTSPPSTPFSVTTTESVTSPSTKSVAEESLKTSTTADNNNSPDKKQTCLSDNNNCIENKAADAEDDSSQIKKDKDKLAVVTIAEGVKFEILSKKDDSIISSAESEYGLSLIHI